MKTAIGTLGFRAITAGLVVFGMSGVAAQASNRPPTYSAQEYRALVIRSQALNDRYGLSTRRLSPQEHRALMIRSTALNRRYGVQSSRLAPQELRALMLRSKALNEMYAARAGQHEAVITSGDGFGWVEAAIGAAAGAGGVLLLAFAWPFRRRRIVSPVSERTT